MSTDSQRLLLHAYLDGALEPASAVALRAQIEADPQLAAELAGASALQKILRARFPLEPVSAAVERRVDAALRPTDDHVGPRRLSARRLIKTA